MTVVRFECHGPTYAVTFSFDSRVVELIKATIPSYARSWWPAHKWWFIDAQWARTLAMTLRCYGYVVAGVDDHRQHERDRRDWARALFDRVGAARAPLVYRLLSKVCHPDHDGDHELQAELNEAYEAYRELAARTEPYESLVDRLRNHQR